VQMSLPLEQARLDASAALSDAAGFWSPSHLPPLNASIGLSGSHKKLSRTNSRSISRSLARSSSRLSPKGFGLQAKYAESCEEVVQQIARNWEVVCGPRLGLGPADAEAIGKVLRDPLYNCSIRSLDLHSNELGAGGARQLVNALSTPTAAPNLVHLCLDDNKLDATAGHAIATLLRLDSPLETIILSRNQLGQTGGRAIVEALKNNTRIQQLDISENQIDAKVGLELAEVLLQSQARKIDISGNDFPSEVDACIKAAVSFSKSTWSREHSFGDALLEARRLKVCKQLQGGDLQDMRAYLEAIAQYWPDETSLTNFMAALHAPIAVGRQNAGDPHCGNFEYKQDSLKFLANLYTPADASKLELPGGHISIGGIFVLNLTPFSLTFGSTRTSAFSCQNLPERNQSQACAKIVVQLACPADADDFVPNVQDTVHIVQMVGEQRHKLSCVAEEPSGELRAMCSMKDLPSVGLYKPRIARMVTLVWAPPPRLCGVELREFKSRWKHYLRYQSASRRALTPEANMYDAVQSWIKPDTAPTQSAFASLCKFGPVNTFVSHWWGSPLPHTLESLERHCNGDEAQRVWICSLANNQWRLKEEMGDGVNASPFRQALASQSCNSMALMLDSDGAPLKRFWCLYEIMTVIILRSEGKIMEFDLCTPEGVINRGQMPVEDGLRMARLLGEINVEHAECSHVKDREMIEIEIRDHLGGFHNMDVQIRSLVEEGLCTLYEKQDLAFRQTYKSLRLGRTFSDVFTDDSSPDPRSPERGMGTRGMVSFTKSDLMAEVEALRKALLQKDAQIAKLSADNQSLKKENYKLRQDNATQRWFSLHNRNKTRGSGSH